MVQVKTRSYFSHVHIRAAAQFARSSGQAEARKGEEPWEALHFEHRAFVIATIFHSAAFLEAAINELFSDAGEPDGGCMRQLPELARRLLADMWDQGVPRTAHYPITRKFDVCLALLQLSPIDYGESEGRDARVLTDLRNALIHYEPEWQLHASHTQNDQKAAHKFERALKGRFSVNPLTGDGNSFYPDKLLGYGCAQWAVGTALHFADGFFAKLGVRAPYDYQREYFSVAIASHSEPAT